MITTRLGDPIISTDKDGNERRSYVTINPDRRTAPHRRMKKDLAEQTALRANKDDTPMTLPRSETRAMFYLNKPEWAADHPFQKSSGLPVKDYDAGDTYNFIKLIQDTSQTKLTSDPVDLSKVPDVLKDKVKYEVFGWPADGGIPKLLGWLSSKPKAWAYALGQIRKIESTITHKETTE